MKKETVGEALRLALLLHELVPERAEVDGLLALLLVNDARQASRLSVDGRSQRISEQDRSAWDHAAILEARELIAGHVQAEHPDQYTLQASIALLHAEAPTYDEVDWREIVRLYDQLLLAWPSPVVQLNRAVALAKTRGPQAALDVVVGLEDDGQLNRYQYLPAVKAYLLDQLGRSDEAHAARTRAFELAANEVERDFILRQND
jgi:RNA polymerase sigma-70 factor (ECF subfamily)